MAGAAGAIGMAMGMVGQIGGTIAKVQATNTQAQVLAREADVIESNARLEEQQQRRRAAIAMGKANALGAASGLDLSSGSTLLMELDRAKQSEIEALSIRRTGDIAATTKRFESRMVRRSIPWTILGGAAQSGSILTQFMGK